MSTVKQTPIVYLEHVRNTQRDNYDWGGKLPSWAQCFYASAVVALSTLIKIPQDKVQEYELEYVDDTEVLVGKKGIAERLIMKFPWLTGRSGQWFIVHQNAIYERLINAGVAFKDVIMYDGSGLWSAKTGKKTVVNKTWEEVVDNPLMNGSFILTTGKFPPTNGHIVPIIGMTQDNYIVEDPYGNALTEYKDTDGHDVQYSKEFMKKYCKGPIVIYVEF
jgi:hypothetical protein